MRNIRQISSKALEVALWLAVVGALAENLVLVRQNRRLREVPSDAQMQVGEHLTKLSGVDLAGEIQPISFPDGPSQTVLVTFSPNCPFCRRTEPIWAALSRSLRDRGVRMLWVSRDSVDETKHYCEEVGISSSDVFADPPNGTFRQLGLEAVPNTVVIGSGGTIEKVWTGALNRANTSQLFAYFGVPETSQPNQ